MSIITLDLQGVDVSAYQSIIDWDKVAKIKSFAITKATEYREDIRFEYNWQEIKRVGLVRGTYLFAHPNEDVDEQIDRFLDSINRLGYKSDDLLVLDLEDGNGDLSDWTLEFLTKVEQYTGLLPLLYSTVSFLQTHGIFEEPRLQRFPLWLANYGPTMIQPPDGWRTVLWQYSSSGQVDGIVGNVDLNVAVEDMMDIKRFDAAMDELWNIKNSLETKNPKTKSNLLAKRIFNAIVNAKEATGRQ